MIFKDTLSIFSKHISLLFKILLYASILMLISMAVLVAIINPIIKEFSANFDIANKLKDTFVLWLDGEAGTFAELFHKIGSFIGAQTGYLSKAIIYSLLLFALLKFFFGLTFLPIAKVINAQMSFNYKEKYTTAMVSLWGKSFVFALIYALITVPFDLIIIVLCYLFLKITYSSFGILAPTIVISALIALFSLRISLINQWVPTIICEDKKVVKSLSVSFKRSIKLFTRVLPTITLLVILMYTVVMTTTIVTFAIVPIIMLPIIMILYNTTCLVAYYNDNSIEYYK